MRADWKEYYLNIATAVAQRSTCLRRRYGAVIVKDNRIISTGYNGSAKGELNCCDTGKCIRKEQNVPHGERYELCVSVHAEANAIINSDPKDLIGSTLYLYGEELLEDYRINWSVPIKRWIPIKAEPCAMCARVIKNAGIKEVKS